MYLYTTLVNNKVKLMNNKSTSSVTHLRLLQLSKPLKRTSLYWITLQIQTATFLENFIGFVLMGYNE